MNPHENRTFSGNRIEVKDIPQYQSMFPRSGLKNFENLETNRPVIVLPEELYFKTIEMCKSVNEKRGYLLIQKNEKSIAAGKFLVEAIIEISKDQGSPYSTFVDDKMFDAFGKVLNEYSNEITRIEYHSHTSTTGGHWDDKFSGGDDQSLSNNVNRDRKYKHVLFTPNNVLTFGMDKPQFKVAEIENNNTRNKQAIWMDRFHEFLKGYK